MNDPIKLSRRTFLFVPFALAACKYGSSVLEISGQTMGTSYAVIARDPGSAMGETEVKALVESVLANVNAQMSNWDTSSEVSLLNRDTRIDEIAVSAELAQVVASANAVNAASDGQFDIALGPLIEAWGFGATPAIGLGPDESAIETALATASRSAPLLVADQHIRKTNATSQINLAGIGKGHGVDRVAQVLKQNGFNDFMVEIGGDLVTSGQNPDGTDWQIGIETPLAFDRRVQKVVGVSGYGMATSGDYRNYFEKDGQRYSHILDAKTGRPVTHNTSSATVLTENAMMADAWSTAMLTLGSQRGLEIAEDHDLAVMFIDRGGDDAFVSKASSRFDAIVG